jgi:hypothetical protein
MVATCHSHATPVPLVHLLIDNNRLRNTSLKANLAKCEFGSSNVSYLGTGNSTRGRKTQAV